MVIDGLRWAPEMWPVDNMTIITASPVDAARPIRVSEPSVFWFTIAVAVPAKIRMRVPMNSAPTFLARETGGGGNEHETGGNVPSSKAQGSTLKHLQLLRRDLLKWPPLLSGLNPPKRGAPGVPGVTGVEGAEATSSESITRSETNSKRKMLGIKDDKIT